jgi:uncharacterized protein involved in exopolysaccharide biosynthesis
MTELLKQPQESDGSSNEESSLLWLLAVILRERRIVIACTAVGVAVGLMIALARKPTYTSSFSFLPQSAQDANAAGLAGLAGQFGISLGSLGGSSQPPQLYADLIVTREVLAPIALDSFSVSGNAKERAPLTKFLRSRGDNPAEILDNALLALRRNVISSSVAARTTGMVTVNVRTASAHVSYELAEKLLQGLNAFNTITRQSQAREERRFTEARYEAARTSLRGAEDALQRFLQANRQYANSPQLSFEQERLQREVNLQQQVVSSLAQKYEDTRIREVRDTPVITVIERPVVASRPDPRLRILILVLATFAAFALGVMMALFRDARQRALGHDPALAQLSMEWKRMRGAKAS